MQPTIAIALSGGIDSLMAASLLRDKGYGLIGLHFLTGYETGVWSSLNSGTGSHFEHMANRVRRHLEPMVRKLDIPLHIIDLRTEFKSLVVDYFVRTYQAGKTPNPCLKCNPAIKFDVLFERAKKYGATKISTGHYARLHSGSDNRMHLLRGVDRAKDQSYFLARLSRTQLESAVLPLGEFTKDQVRKMAREKGLQPAVSQESQDICFIKDGTYGAFLMQQPGFSAEPGPIVDIHGKLLGQHNGLHRFTVGQRRGINCPAAEPYYVIRLDTADNRLIVGRKTDLLTRAFEVRDINWIAPAPRNPIAISVRVRYRHEAVPATLTPKNGARAEIKFEAPHPAVTPGQGAVFYQKDEVLGGGWIQ